MFNSFCTYLLFADFGKDFRKLLHVIFDSVKKWKRERSGQSTI